MTRLIGRRQFCIGGLAVAASVGFAKEGIGAAYHAGPISQSARLTGKIVFSGPIPPPREFKVFKDTTICGEGPIHIHAINETARDGLQDAIVQIVGVTSGKPWDGVGEEAKIFQQACQFSPRVQAVKQGANLQVINLDPILHNIHAYEQIGRGRRTLFSHSQTRLGQEDHFELNLRKSNLVRIQCDAHSWMSSWIRLLENPYAAITDKSGSFVIDDVPAGEFMVKIWHPFIDEQVLPMSFEAGGAASLDLDLKARGS